MNISLNPTVSLFLLQKQKPIAKYFFANAVKSYPKFISFADVKTSLENISCKILLLKSESFSGHVENSNCTKLLSNVNEFATRMQYSVCIKYDDYIYFQTPNRALSKDTYEITWTDSDFLGNNIVTNVYKVTQNYANT